MVARLLGHFGQVRIQHGLPRGHLRTLPRGPWEAAGGRRVCALAARDAGRGHGHGRLALVLDVRHAHSPGGRHLLGAIGRAVLELYSTHLGRGMEFIIHQRMWICVYACVGSEIERWKRFECEKLLDGTLLVDRARWRGRLEQGEAEETGEKRVASRLSRASSARVLRESSRVHCSGRGCHQRESENWEERQGREHGVGMHMAMHAEDEADSEGQKRRLSRRGYGGRTKVGNSSGSSNVMAR